MDWMDIPAVYRRAMKKRMGAQNVLRQLYLQAGPNKTTPDAYAGFPFSQFGVFKGKAGSKPLTALIAGESKLKQLGMEGNIAKSILSQKDAGQLDRLKTVYNARLAEKNIAATAATNMANMAGVVAGGVVPVVAGMMGTAYAQKKYNDLARANVELLPNGITVVSSLLSGLFLKKGDKNT